MRTKTVEVFKMVGSQRVVISVLVHVIDTYGEWSVKDLLPVEQLAGLARWANDYETAERNRLRRLRLEPVTA